MAEAAKKEDAELSLDDNPNDEPMASKQKLSLDEPKNPNKEKAKEAPKADDDEKKKDDADDKKKKEARWLALESNPGSLNKFAERMGLDLKKYSFTDVWGLDKELLGFLPQPVKSIVLLFPSTKEISTYKAKQAEEIKKKGQKLSKDLFYITQHDNIGNACGTIAMLHCLANSGISDALDEKKELKKFMKVTKDMDSDKRGWALVEAKSIQEQSDSAAQDRSENQTSAPERNQSVNAHFIAFICKDDCLYELDGRKQFPINHGKSSDKEFVYDAAKVIKEKFMGLVPNNPNFNMIALTKTMA